MKNNIYTFCVLLMLGVHLLNAQNLALTLDGKDNNVRTGIGFLKAPWTVEAWIKGNDLEWKHREVILGGGEYSTYSQADNFPLVLEEGRLCNVKSGIKSSEKLDDRWHHVALTCDESGICLYLDGKLEAEKDTVITILPGAIGVSESSESVFAGQIDEVRIWNAYLTAEIIREWMSKPLYSAHPDFNSLVAYYNFDAGIDDTALNWVGSGYLSYHLRNGRLDYAGNTPVAYASLASNTSFEEYEGKQRVFNTVSIESEWDVDRGSCDNQIMKMRICVQGKKNPVRLCGFTLNLSQTSRLEDVSKVSVYYTGQKARSKKRELLYEGKPSEVMTVKLPSHLRTYFAEGANYLLVTADIAPDAQLNDTVRIRMESLVLNGKRHYPEFVRPYRIPIQITENSYSNVNVFRVLQWNIWHGGRHVPLAGKERIVELLKASGADVITMQEAYGFQDSIAAALNFNLQTPSSQDNLALFSRFPLKKLPTFHEFRSNPALAYLPNGEKILIEDCWLRFSTHPDYTGSYADVLHNPNEWIREDSVVSMADAARMLRQEIEPVLKTMQMPVVIGGDFNSYSHLDWTAGAAHLHAGYGPIAFPASRLMAEQGYIDSFRAVHLDEVLRPEGTFAGIYGQLDFARIDFIYYKGAIRAISSKIIQTQPEIDDIWASDHSAVLTTFECLPLKRE